MIRRPRDISLNRRAAELDRALDVMLQGAPLGSQTEFAGELATARRFARLQPEAAPPLEALNALQEALAARIAGPGPARVRPLRLAVEASAAVAAALVALAGFRLVDTSGPATTPGMRAVQLLQTAHERLAVLASRAAAGQVDGVGSTVEEARSALLQTEEALVRLPPGDPEHQALLSSLNVDISELNGLLDQLHLAVPPLATLRPASQASAKGSIAARSDVSGSAATNCSAAPSTSGSASGDSTSSAPSSSTTSSTTSSSSTTSTTSTTSAAGPAALTRSAGHTSASSSTSSSTTSSSTTTTQPVAGNGSAGTGQSGC